MYPFKNHNRGILFFIFCIVTVYMFLTSCSYSTKTCTTKGCDENHTHIVIRLSSSVLSEENKSTITIHLLQSVFYLRSKLNSSKKRLIEYENDPEKPLPIQTTFVTSVNAYYDTETKELHISLKDTNSLWYLEKPPTLFISIHLKEKELKVMEVKDYGIIFSDLYFPNGEDCHPKCWKAKYTIER